MVLQTNLGANNSPQAAGKAAQESTASIPSETPRQDPQEVTSKQLEDIEISGANEITSIGDLLDDIIKKALDAKASDVHIEPREQDVIVRYRIDGILKDVRQIDKQLEKSLIFKIKVNAKLRTDEHFAPQDGRIRFKFDDKLDTRISIMPTTQGEKVVIRLLTQKGKSFKLEDLGMGPHELGVVQRAYMKPYGSILVSGPTGSGKTTTLYSILQIINSREINITTIEDPVEYEIVGVNHVHINTKAGLTFARGLRSILRQDPNVIMIGEIRDDETAKISTESAMTGHLVLSTIHTNDSVTTIPRLMDMGVDSYLVANTLNVVIAQRLGRKLCEKCKTPYTITQQDLVQLQKIRPDIVALLKPGVKIFKEKGCSECVSGYKGRIGLYEVLEINEPIRKIIMEDAGTDAIFNLARKQGLVLIVEDGVNKLMAGILSMSELLRVTALKE